MPKLSAADARELRELHADGWTPRELAERYGVSDTTVSDTVRGKVWREAGGPLAA
jgi:transcriptional regulator with XRE-family HTH domain